MAERRPPVPAQQVRREVTAGGRFVPVVDVASLAPTSPRIGPEETPALKQRDPEETLKSKSPRFGATGGTGGAV